MRNHGNVWIPEAPTHPGLYANLLNPTDGKVSFGLAISTMDPCAARQFETEAECADWCNANPTPVFVPVAHGFM